ncbi:MAG: c-type cytochrome domain-containing protein [Pirellulales bacterium]
MNSQAATLAQQRAELNRVGTLLRSAERFAKADRSDEAAAAFTEAQEKLQSLLKEGVDDRLKRTFTRAAEVIAQQHETLTAAGVKLPALAEIDPSNAMRASDKEGNRGNTDVSFSKDIAPVLAAKCGTCHIDQRRGTFSLATYAALMQGSQRGGRVIVPGEGVGSVLVDKIDSGEMPRGDGPRVTPDELAALVKWINQGANFDGPNPDQPLPELSATPGAAPEPMPAPKAVPLVHATGKETVSFALHVAPILIGRCGDCHGGDNTSGNLSLATFTRLLQGGDSGVIVGTADPEESLLIKKLRGTAGQRMPLNRPPLSDQQIGLIATWIREGSKFDGPDPTETLERTSAVVRAGRATSEELTQIREGLAAENWRLALPDEKPGQVVTARFLLIGAVPEQQLREWGEMAEAQADEVLKAFGRPADEPLSKSRITLFVFGSRIDFSEFATMVERRDLGKEELGSWSYDIVDAYGCVLPAAQTSKESATLFAQQIAAISLAERGQGRLPDWLVEGAARTVVAKLAPRDPRVVEWQELLPLAAAELKQPDDFMRGKLAPETTAVLSYGFLGPLMRNSRSFDQLLERIAAGDTVDEALKAAYRHDGAELAKVWLASRKRGRQ